MKVIGRSGRKKKLFVSKSWVLNMPTTLEYKLRLGGPPTSSWWKILHGLHVWDNLKNALPYSMSILLGGIPRIAFAYWSSTILVPVSIPRAAQPHSPPAVKNSQTTIPKPEASHA
jgi:hypothetical protein